MFLCCQRHILEVWIFSTLDLGLLVMSTKILKLKNDLNNPELCNFSNNPQLK